VSAPSSVIGLIGESGIGKVSFESSLVAC
jgi:ABC-type dipeptide/oligopeptide/nickel transport system ATPase subunit